MMHNPPRTDLKEASSKKPKPAIAPVVPFIPVSVSDPTGIASPRANPFSPVSPGLIRSSSTIITPVDKSPSHSFLGFPYPRAQQVISPLAPLTRQSSFENNQFQRSGIEGRSSLTPGSRKDVVTPESVGVRSPLVFYPTGNLSLSAQQALAKRQQEQSANAQFWQRAFTNPVSPN